MAAPDDPVRPSMITTRYPKDWFQDRAIRYSCPGKSRASRFALRVMLFSMLEIEMHGEYKTPGGKLVRVDFDVRDGAMQDVVVSGDFFLYPEEALHDITNALAGLPADLATPAIADRVAAALPAGTEWLGSSADALAIAVNRARSDSGMSDV